MTTRSLTRPRNIAVLGIASLAATFGAGFAKAEPVEVSYGLDLVSNYLSKGFTQTDDNPALQGYADFSFGAAYIGMFVSNASFGGASDVEFDLGFGYRPDLGNSVLDIGFVQYFYRDDKTNYGEAFIKAGHNVSETTYLGFRYYREIYANYDTLYGEASVTGLPWDLTVSGGVGSDFGTRNLGQDAVYADLGVTKELGDHASFDLRAHYSAIEGNRLVATISLYNNTTARNIALFNWF